MSHAQAERAADALWCSVVGGLKVLPRFSRGAGTMRRLVREFFTPKT